MTNSKNGLKNRLKQFDDGIRGKKGHGGAARVRHKHKNYKEMAPKLFVSVALFKCEVSSNKPSDLIMMGKVAEFEYRCLANYVARYKELPEFNDKERSPKK